MPNAIFFSTSGVYRILCWTDMIFISIFCHVSKEQRVADAVHWPETQTQWFLVLTGWLDCFLDFNKLGVTSKLCVELALLTKRYTPSMRHPSRTTDGALLSHVKSATININHTVLACASITLSVSMCMHGGDSLGTYRICCSSIMDRILGT